MLIFIGTVLTSVIITLAIVFFGIVWYNKRLEAQAKEATKQLTAMLKSQASQEQNDYLNKLHSGNDKGFLQ